MAPLSDVLVSSTRILVIKGFKLYRTRGDSPNTGTTTQLCVYRYCSSIPVRSPRSNILSDVILLGSIHQVLLSLKLNPKNSQVSAVYRRYNQAYLHFISIFILFFSFGIYVCVWSSASAYVYECVCTWIYSCLSSRVSFEKKKNQVLLRVDLLHTNPVVHPADHSGAQSCRSHRLARAVVAEGV